jgi:zinc-binding alcohol dehydrogenase family protein
VKAIAFRMGSAIDDADGLVEVERPAPTPGPRDLLVAVRAVSVNPVDTKVRRGLVPVPAGQDILGWDASGVVEAVGSDVSLFRRGDEVFYAGFIGRQGANAELHVVDERLVGRKPRTLGFAEAAALPLTALTAYQLLFHRLGAVPGKQPGPGQLLILGAAGGVGSILMQLASRLTALPVIATASREESRRWCLELGAHHVIDHGQPLPGQLRALGFPTVSLIAALSHTALHYAELIEAVAPQGRIGIIDDHDTLDAAPLKAKSASLHWEMIFTRPLFDTPDMIVQHRILDEIALLVDSGAIRATASENLGRLSATTLRRAHARLEQGHTVGKLVLDGF